ncbi:hypothetical protein ACR6C2_00185 [Streptomyces sp. INA 01156]
MDVVPIAGTVALLASTENLRSSFLDVLREDMLKQLGTACPDKKNTAAGAYSFAPAFDVFHALSPADYRSPEDFQEEVEEYLRKFDRAMQQSLVQAIHIAGAPLTLKLTNPGEENLTKVEVVLSLPDTVMARVTDDDEEVDWPDPPKEYGTAALPIGVGVFAGMAAVRSSTFSLSSLHAPDIEHEGDRTIIRFVPVDLRPHESVTLDPITLYSTQEAAACRSSGSGVQRRRTSAAKHNGLCLSPRNAWNSTWRRRFFL